MVHTLYEKTKKELQKDNKVFVLKSFKITHCTFLENMVAWNRKNNKKGGKITMFKHLEENRQAELEYCIGLTENLEQPTKTLVQDTFKKNINAMSKNEKNYYMTRIAELLLAAVIVAVNIVPLELFAVFKISVVLLDARIWTILFAVSILFCIALDSLFQFRDTWQKQKELVQELKNECLKYSCKLGVYSGNMENDEVRVVFLQRFLELTGERYSLFEYQTKQQKKAEIISEKSDKKDIEIAKIEQKQEKKEEVA